MTVHELKERFLKVRDYEPLDVNELLDFAKKAYIHNEITITEYRQLVRDLELQGAHTPPEKREGSIIEKVY